MIRKFVAGIVWGGVVASAGVVVLSQLAPMPGKGSSATLAPVTAVVPAPEPVVIPAPPAIVTAPPLPDKPAVVPQPPIAMRPADQPVAGEEAAGGKIVPVLPTLDATAPAAPPMPNGAKAAPELQTKTDAAPKAVAPEMLANSGSSDAAPKPADMAVPEPVPPQTNETLLQPAPGVVVNQTPALITLDPAPLPQALAQPAQIEADKTETLPPPEGLARTVDGVTLGRLPRIGDQAEAQAEDTRPLTRFARVFSNDAGKPLFAILLRDTGEADMDRAQLATLPFPISFVIDPLLPTAKAAAEIYRAAGQEVIMLGSGIPKGAKANDLEQTFQANGQVLPQAVAVMDPGVGGFQNSRALAALVVPAIKAQGRGVLTLEGGLNAADQVARRDGVPAAVIFRVLDGAGESVPVIRRYLDRAAFKAAQEGQVLVLGSTKPDTISALMEWALEGRGSPVALAPVTAVLAVQ